MDRAALDAAYAAAARYLEDLHARPVGSAAALRLLGLGDACVVKVKSDSQGRMLPEALRAAEGAPAIISPYLDQSTEPTGLNRDSSAGAASGIAHRSGSGPTSGST